MAHCSCREAELGRAEVFFHGEKGRLLSPKVKWGHDSGISKAKKNMVTRNELKLECIQGLLDLKYVS